MTGRAASGPAHDAADPNRARSVCLPRRADRDHPGARRSEPVHPLERAKSPQFKRSPARGWRTPAPPGPQEQGQQRLRPAIGIASGHLPPSTERQHASPPPDSPPRCPVRFPRAKDDGRTLEGVPEAAKYLGLPPRTMHDLIGRKEMHTTGWPMRIASSELEDFVRRSRVKPGELRHLHKSRPGRTED